MQFEGLSTIFEYAEKSGILLPVLIVLVVIVYASKVTELIDSWKMRKIKHLSNLYENELLTEEIKKMVQDEINNAAFKSIHGIRVDTLMREQLNNLHNRDKDRFTWKRLRMADTFMEMDDNKLVIKTHWYDRVYYVISWFGLVSSIMLFLSGWINFVIVQNIDSFVVAISLLVISWLLFFLFLYWILECIQAKRLIGYMNQLDDKGDK